MRILPHCDLQTRLKKKAKRIAITKDFDIAERHNKYDRGTAKRVAKAVTSQLMAERFREIANPVLQQYFVNWNKVPKYLAPDYVESQFLSRHGANAAYLHRFKINRHDKCLCDPDTTQTVPHIVLDCPRFNDIREEELKDEDYDLPFTVTKLNSFFKSKAHKRMVHRIHPALVREHQQNDTDTEASGDTTLLNSSAEDPDLGV